MTGYSPPPVVKSVKTARVKGAVEITFAGFTQPNRKRSLTRSQYKRFTASASAGIGQNDGRAIIHAADATNAPAKQAGQKGKCLAYLSVCTETLPGFDAVERSSIS